MVPRVFLAVVLCLTASLVQDVHAFSLATKSTHMHVPHFGSAVVMCQADERITACHIRIHKSSTPETIYPLLDVSSGATQLVNVTDDKGRVGLQAQYHGKGLKHGQCGVALTRVQTGKYLVSCRARAADALGGWQQNVVTIDASGFTNFSDYLEWKKQFKDAKP